MPLHNRRAANGTAAQEAEEEEEEEASRKLGQEEGGQVSGVGEGGRDVSAGAAKRGKREESAGGPAEAAGTGPGPGGEPEAAFVG